jgi:hypothetical protein
MGLFDKLFFRRAHPDAERAKTLIRQSLKDSEGPQGAHKMAEFGAELHRRFFALLEEVEANHGVCAVGIAGAEGVLMVHPKLMEEIRKQP